MGNMHRIAWFDQQIRAGKYPNSSLLAKQFEISARQAARDIEYMASSLRAPLQYAAKHRGYRYEDETFVLPYVYMSDEEKRVLKYLALRYRHYNYDNAESVRRVADLLGRFEGTEGGGEAALLKRLPVFDANPETIQHIELLSHAIEAGVSVHIVYQDREGQRNVHLSPIRFAARYHADYIVGYAEGEERPVSLRLDGICQLSVGGPAFGAGASVADAPNGEGGKPQRAPFLAKLRLAAELQGGNWSGYRIFEDDDESFVYTVAFYDADSFMQQLLVSEWEELLSPGWLKAKLRDRGERLLRRLEAPGRERSGGTDDGEG